MTSPRSFADGQFVQHQGDPGDAFWAVIEGHVLVGRYAEDGAFTAFAVLGPGDIFGELAFFTGLERQVDAIASGPARLDCRRAAGAPLNSTVTTCELVADMECFGDEKILPVVAMAAASTTRVSAGPFFTAQRIG